MEFTYIAGKVNGFYNGRRGCTMLEDISYSCSNYYSGSGKWDNTGRLPLRAALPSSKLLNMGGGFSDSESRNTDRKAPLGLRVLVPAV